MSALMLEHAPEGFLPLSLELPPALEFDDAEFEEFCWRNRDLRIEQDREGNVIIMAPVGNEGGHQELNLGSQLQVWSARDGTGLAFSSSTLFTLPNGAKRGPDASWLRREKWEAISPAERRGFSHLCPDFVIELRSVSDRLPPLRKKMEEYLENGTTLGFLIDPQKGRAHIYRPDRAIDTLERPAFLSAEPEMPGLIFDLTRIW